MEIGRKSQREIPEGQNLNVSRETANGYTPYSQMTENTLFFCLHVNWPLLPRFKPNIPLNSAGGQLKEKVTPETVYFLKSPIKR